MPLYAWYAHCTALVEVYILYSATVVAVIKHRHVIYEKTAVSLTGEETHCTCEILNIYYVCLG